MLRIYPVLLDLVRSVSPLLRDLDRRDPDLARQCRRALNRMTLKYIAVVTTFEEKLATELGIEMSYALFRCASVTGRVGGSFSSTTSTDPVPP